MANFKFTENAEFTQELFEALLKDARVSNPKTLVSQETGENLGRKYIITGDGLTRLIVVIWNGQNIKRYYGGKLYLESKTESGKSYFGVRPPLEQTAEVCMDFCIPTEAELEAAKRREAAQRGAATRAANRAAKRS